MSYIGMSKQIKDALVALLEAIQLDGEPAFANVLDNNRGVFEGDPNVQVLPGDLSLDRPTVQQADKAPMFILRVRIPMEGTDQSQSQSYDQMYNLTDLVIDAINNADNDSSLGVAGVYMMDALRGDWVEYPSSGGVELICDVNVQITYSKTLV